MSSGLFDRACDLSFEDSLRRETKGEDLHMQFTFAGLALTAYCLVRSRAPTFS